MEITQGEFLKCFRYFNMGRAGKGRCMYNGMGKDGKFRTCKLDYHSDGTPVAPGTADKMAKDLLFENVRELKEFMRTNM